MSQRWRTITDYESDPEALADKELRALSGVWIDRKTAIGESTSVSEFTERLKREWAIETGLIERLYTLDLGITELMIEHGVNAAFIPDRPGNMTPSSIATMIGNQRDAIESVFAFVKGNRQLSTSYVKSLHSLFTRNQEHVEALDPLGRKIQVPLIHGDYKQQPNNPTRSNGSIYYYCPPEHVASEMDRLIELHLDHQDVAPEVEAAWLHHRFTQIHPFQDGNGRLARALATLVFIKANWLPLVVRNSDRKRYIDALELADGGNLKPLVSFFSSLQKTEFIRAIGIMRDTEQAMLYEKRIESIKQHISQRRDTLEKEWEAAIYTATQMQTFAKKRLDEVANDLRKAMSNVPEFTFSVDEATNESPRSHFFHRQIVSTAKKIGYYANTRRYRSWVRLTAKNSIQSNILIAFHCIGHDFQGVLACSGTWFFRALTDDQNYETGGEATLNDEVFQINYKDEDEDALFRFEDWLERVIERGLAFWEAAL